MINDLKEYDILRQEVESTAGFKMKGHKSFTELCDQISRMTNSILSVTTLKRFWGAIETSGTSKVRSTTLDVLSQYVGYSSWNNFVENVVNNKEGVGSHIITGNKLETRSLEQGQVVTLRWRPGRCVKVRFEGMDMFTVLENQNSKLQVGSTFHCSSFFEHRPCYMTCVFSHGTPPFDYVCGEAGGISYSI